MFTCCTVAYDVADFQTHCGRHVLKNILSYWYLVQVFTVIIPIKIFLSKKVKLNAFYSIYVYYVTRGIIKQG